MLFQELQGVQQRQTATEDKISRLAWVVMNACHAIQQQHGQGGENGGARRRERDDNLGAQGRLGGDSKDGKPGMMEWMAQLSGMNNTGGTLPTSMDQSQQRAGVMQGSGLQHHTSGGMNFGAGAGQNIMQMQQPMQGFAQSVGHGAQVKQDGQAQQANLGSITGFLSPFSSVSGNLQSLTSLSDLVKVAQTHTSARDHPADQTQLFAHSPSEANAHDLCVAGRAERRDSGGDAAGTGWRRPELSAAPTAEPWCCRFGAESDAGQQWLFEQPQHAQPAGWGCVPEHGRRRHGRFRAGVERLDTSNMAGTNFSFPLFNRTR